jgi:hypothetical protein
MTHIHYTKNKENYGGGAGVDDAAKKHTATVGNVSKAPIWDYIRTFRI